MARGIRECSGPKKILEVGPGSGPITRAIIPHVRSGDVFDLVEINPAFCQIVERDVLIPARRSIPDATIRLFQGPVQDVPLQGPYDFVVSAIPFNNFEPELVQVIFERLQSLVAPAGRLDFFEYAGIRRLRALVSNKQDRERLWGISEVLARFHQQKGTSRKLVLLNFPPTTKHSLQR